MAKILEVALMLAISAYVDCVDVNVTNCAKDITVLESILYRPNNLFQLKIAFYPPREMPTRFIKVTYKFDDNDNCNVTYIWAIGGFLLIQPPQIFQFTSLYFSTPANNLTDLVIQLPNECRSLVDDSCTCKSHDNDILDVLTQQLNIYAKYNDPQNVISEHSIHVQAICDEELEENYYSNRPAQLFMICFILIPIFFIATTSTCVRSFHEEINQQLRLKQNYATIASLAITGVFAQAVILGMDVAAFSYLLFEKHEYIDYHEVKDSINANITYATFGLDFTIGLIMLLCLIYFWCTLCHRDCSKNCSKCVPCLNMCLEYIMPLFFASFLYCVFGSKHEQSKKTWKMPQKYVPRSDDTEANRLALEITVQRTSWILLIMLLSPLFSIASHGGYILAAWLTEPSKATETALIAMAIIVYTSLVFRQCYVANADINLQFRCWSCCIMFYPLLQVLQHIPKCCMTTICYYCDLATMEIPNDNQYELQSVEPNEGELTHLLKGHKKTNTEEPLNTQALCIALIWGLVVVGSLTLTIVAFYLIPFKTLDLATYLLNIFQIFVVMIGILITYKILTIGEPEINRFLKNVRKAYYKNNRRKENDLVDDVEAVGAITGNALDALVKPGV